MGDIIDGKKDDGTKFVFTFIKYDRFYTDGGCLIIEAEGSVEFK